MWVYVILSGKSRTLQGPHSRYLEKQPQRNFIIDTVQRKASKPKSLLFWDSQKRKLISCLTDKQDYWGEGRGRRYHKCHKGTLEVKSVSKVLFLFQCLAQAIGISFPLPVPALKLKLSYFSTVSSPPKTTHMNTSSLWPGQSPQRLELTSVFTMGILLTYTALIWEAFGTFCYGYSGWVTDNELKGQVS